LETVEEEAEVAIVAHVDEAEALEDTTIEEMIEGMIAEMTIAEETTGEMTEETTEDEMIDERTEEMIEETIRETIEEKENETQRDDEVAAENRKEMKNDLLPKDPLHLKLPLIKLHSHYWTLNTISSVLL
jgi:hypothetical protein